jgi:hypothetical protein
MQQNPTAGERSGIAIDTLSGLLIFATLIMALIDTFGLAVLALPATLTAWAFVLLEYLRLNRKQRIQISVLCAIGAAFTGWAWSQGSDAQLIDLLGEHLKLAMLLAAVNFIRLSTQLAPATDSPGPRSFLLTLGGMHLFSSVANFSSMLLVGEQIKRKGTLSPLSQIILARGFSLAIMWSPFLSILPLVLEQVPGAELYSIYPFSAALAVIGLLITFLDVRHRHNDEYHHYSGFPMTLGTLLLPLCLISTILLAAWIWPQLPTVGAVSLLAILTPLMLLTLRRGPLQATSRVIEHITQRLADTRAEISLFLSAGFLAAGVKACIAVGLIDLPFTHTDATVASMVMISIVVLAYLGIHQFALVAICAGLLADVTTAPTLMAIAYIVATSVSMSGSTFSGVNFILQARFACPARSLLKNNLNYSVMMLVAASLLMYLMQYMGVR